MALYAAEKLLELGAIPVTFSDSSGHIFEPEVRSFLCVCYLFCIVFFLRRSIVCVYYGRYVVFSFSTVDISYIHTLQAISALSPSKDVYVCDVCDVCDV